MTNTQERSDEQAGYPFGRRGLFGRGDSSLADETAGKIAAVDETTGTVVLEDGTAFAIGESVSVDGLTAGTEVKVSYEDQGGLLVATEISPSN